MQGVEHSLPRKWRLSLQNASTEIAHPRIHKSHATTADELMAYELLFFFLFLSSLMVLENQQVPVHTNTKYKTICTHKEWLLKYSLSMAAISLLQ